VRTSILGLLVAVLAGLVLARENRLGDQSKEPSANTTPHPGDRKLISATVADSRTYKSNDFGFRFSYPADWSVFEHVKTYYVERGLPAAFNLCLTSGPVKELRCDIELYVIPEKQFIPPATLASTFLGLPTLRPASESGQRFGKVASRLFVVMNPSDESHMSIYNYCVVQNGYAYLWVYRGKYPARPTIVDPSDKVLTTFHFFAPVK
jgi:hypothetical protein